MINPKSIVFGALSTLLLFGALVLTQNANATVTCKPIYGGGEDCIDEELRIDKKVLMPNSSSDFRDKITLDQFRFRDGHTVKFRLSVTNHSDSDLTNVKVRDILPDFLTFASGSGSFDANTRTLTYTIDRLNRGQTDTREITARVNEPTNINNGSVCIVNQSFVEGPRGLKDQDNASVCIERKVLGKGGPVVQPPVQLPKTPATGPGLAILALLPTALTGIYLRRKIKLVK